MKICFIFLFSLFAMNAFSQDIIELKFNGLVQPVKAFKESVRNDSNGKKVIVIAEDYFFQNSAFKLDIKKGTPITYDKSNLVSVENTNGTEIKMLELVPAKYNPKWITLKIIYFQENLVPTWLKIFYTPKERIFRVKTKHDIAQCYDYVAIYPSGALSNCYLDAPLTFEQGGLQKVHTSFSVNRGFYENGTAKSLFSNRVDDDSFYIDGCSKTTRVDWAEFNEKGFAVSSIQLMEPIKFVFQGKVKELGYIVDAKDCKASFMLTEGIKALHEGYRIISSNPKVSSHLTDAICKKQGYLESFRDTKTTTEFIVSEETFFDIDLNTYKTIKTGNVNIAPVAWCGTYIEVPLN